MPPIQLLPWTWPLTLEHRSATDGETLSCKDSLLNIVQTQPQQLSTECIFSYKEKWVCESVMHLFTRGQHWPHSGVPCVSHSGRSYHSTQQRDSRPKEPHWHSLAHFVCVPSSKARINSRSPLVFMLEVIELFHTLFIQLLSLRNPIVATVPINENKLHKNASLSPVYKPLLQCEKLVTADKISHVCDTAWMLVHANLGKKTLFWGSQQLAKPP